MRTNTERGVSAALEFLQQNAEHNLKQLDEFLRIPSVSAAPEHRPDVERGRQLGRR